MALSMKRRSMSALAGFIFALTCAWVALVMFLGGSPALPGHQQDQLDRQEQRHIVLGLNETGGGNQASLQNIVFGIAGSSHLWSRRKEFIRLWWKPGDMRGFVWLDQGVPDWDAGLPHVKVSDDTFGQTLDSRHPTGIRISRILLETFKLGLPDVHWFVLCDDDTIFSVTNLVNVLRKYDPSELYYIGSISESHGQNVAFSYGMAFGGGGFAISYALAKALVDMQDECLQRYPKLAGSDDRVHACISELGVPLTREPGFHQFDIRGNALGLLASHPVTPFVSLHHVEAIDPVFPDLDALQGLEVLSKAMKLEGAAFLQQAMCYDTEHELTFSISSGYVVQVYSGIVYPKELERTEITFKAWNRKSKPEEFDFNTRPKFWPCKQPSVFYMSQVEASGGGVLSHFRRFTSASRLCAHWSGAKSLPDTIRVVSEPLSQGWYKNPRRRCCRVGPRTPDGNMNLHVGNCKPRETLIWGSQVKQQLTARRTTTTKTVQ